MPHIVAKLRSGYSELQKERLASSLAECVVQSLDCPMFDVSVGIEDVPQIDWAESVHRAEVRDKSATIYKLPGNVEN